MIIAIIGESISLNEYINAERTNRFIAAKMKKEEMERIMWQLPAMTFTNRIHLTFQAYVKNKRKDPDNIYTIFIKFFLDSLVKKGLIENDGQKQIGRIVMEEVIEGEPRIDIEIKEE